jgi:hypothetical protein
MWVIYINFVGQVYYRVRRQHSAVIKEETVKNGEAYQRFAGFRTTYDSLTRKLLWNNKIEFRNSTNLFT